MAHVEMIQTMILMLTKKATIEEIKEADMGGYYAIRDKAIYPADSVGNPWTAAYIQSIGDVVADLHEDLAAEQKARAVYEHLLTLTDDPLLKDGLRFLREREVVHFQRFGEALRNVEEYDIRKKQF
ncbi:manganese catalase family protein [Geosporobacter ferrireducens]|nr:catalase [Geosporobacter ferrireducens]